MQELPGTVVVARGRRQLVLDVADHGECRSVRLAPIGGDRAVTLLQPFDSLQPVPARGHPRRTGRRRVARACAAAARDSFGPADLRAAIGADIRALPWQLDPVLAVLRGDADRLLLADEVGLGKTIQAGLILAELRARGALARALILTPAGLRDQWAAELLDRFRLESRRMDAAALAELQRSLPPWVNPWTLPGITVASIDLLKRGELLPQLEHVIWDAVVVDEAHHATRGTDRHAAAGLTCARARLAILVTATPHGGDDRAFADLQAIGSSGPRSPLLTFRRTRAAVATAALARRTRVVPVTRTAAERHLHDLLAAYTSRVWRASLSRDARLAMIVLRKRALSGAASLARSLGRRLEALGPETPAARDPAQLPLEFPDTLGGELVPDDEEPTRVLEAPGLEDGASERDLLQTLHEAAVRAMESDSRARTLVKLLCRSGEPAIVFTEFRDTLADLLVRLRERVPVSILHGLMLPAERAAAIAAFRDGRARVLLATDAAAEGLNLHHRCRWVIHYEAPWSPARVEQRNGRVDRLGQTRRVHVWHLVAIGSEESAILAVLARKATAAARALREDEEVARSVFEGLPLEVPMSRSEPAPASREAREQAGRLEALRRIPAATPEPGGGVLARVGRRGPFAALPSRHVLAVFQVSVLDGGGHRLATDCFGLVCRSLTAAAAIARTAAGVRARRAIAIHRRAERRRARRESALAAALSGTGPGAVQPSLFDRRALVAADRRRAERAQAQRELDLQRTGRRDACRAFRVMVSLAGGFMSR